MSGLVVVNDRRDPAEVERLLELLPDWFGIESANRGYVESAKTMPTYLALVNEEVVGVLLVARHFDGSAEIHLMAVDPSYHRLGIGRRLLDAVETDLVRDDVGYLFVKTMGPSDPDAYYARTRLFYEASGFTPLEEMHDVWPDDPMLLMVKSLRP